jgi:DNA mismatch endonuclease (patch repair protein)
MPSFKNGLHFETTEERSIRMSNIKSKNTKFEIFFRKRLWKSGIRYRINYKKLPGSPDIVINSKKIVVFIDGEFWHGYNWEIKKTKIKANRDYWIPKIERNIKRDFENNLALQNLGYTVLRFWEQELKKNFDECINKVTEMYINKNI